MEPDEKESNLVHPSVGSSSIVITTSARPEAQLPTPASNTSLVMNDEKDSKYFNLFVASLIKIAKLFTISCSSINHNCFLSFLSRN